jgi:erythronate-4-phosphate dehydrogenase
MKIVADTNIPFLKGVFEPFAEVVYKEGRQIGREDLPDADALIIRTRTRCDADLLDGTAVRIISTATIGTDHIDLDYCRERGIEVHNASGCNCIGVMNYVFSALYGIASRKSLNLEGMTFGIVGVGHVGGAVERMARTLGFNVLLCDPPRAEAEGPEAFCSLDYLLEHADIVSLHTPLDENTRGMADESFFEKIRPGTIFINASRGEVVDEVALMHAIPKLGTVIIDTWAGEPNVNQNLISQVDIATPHIAGYSYQGKLNGTSAAVRSVASFFGIDALKDFSLTAESPELQPLKLELEGKTQGQIAAIFQYNYPIFIDDFMFRMAPGDFEKLRSEYHYRREFYV